MSLFEEKLISFLEDRENLPVSGNALLIYKDEKELFRHMTGTSRRETLYRVYSMTKLVTVTCALQLWEQGRFSLEDPLYRFMPEFEHMTVWNEQKQCAEAAKKPIVMRDLFCMTAGFTYEGDWGEVPRRAKAVRAELEKQYPGEGYTTQSYIRALAGIPLAFEPGTHWQYSLCHDVLGAVIEVISGMTLGEYMKKHIFDVLGMEHTFFRCPRELLDLLAPNGDGGAQDAKFMQGARYESGGGGLLSTLDDYMTFARMLNRGGQSGDGRRILRAETVEMLRRDWLTEEQKKDFNWDYLHGYSYGLGARTLVSPGTDGIPGTRGEFGWCGVLGTWVLMDPERGLVCVYMHQRYPNLEKYVQLGLRPLIYGLIDE